MGGVCGGLILLIEIGEQIGKQVFAACTVAAVVDAITLHNARRINPCPQAFFAAAGTDTFPQVFATLFGVKGWSLQALDNTAVDFSPHHSTPWRGTQTTWQLLGILIDLIAGDAPDFQSV